MTSGVTVKWGKVCVKEKGSAFPVDDFLQGAGGEAWGVAGTLPLQQWLYILPLSQSVGIISTGSKLICGQLDHILSPFPLANMKKSFKDCGSQKVFRKCLLKNK